MRRQARFLFSGFRLWRVPLLAIALACLAACTELACDLGCDEEQDDCLDAPGAYDHFARCTNLSGAAENACHEQLCEDLHTSCRRDCDSQPLPPIPGS